MYVSVCEHLHWRVCVNNPVNFTWTVALLLTKQAYIMFACCDRGTAYSLYTAEQRDDVSSVSSLPSL